MTQTTAAIRFREDRDGLSCYPRWPIALDRGAGVTVWDTDGREYLDLYGGHCVTLLGHAHPRWLAALAHQAERLGFCSNLVYSEPRANFQERLLAFSPEHLHSVFLCNSGAEANETAVKLALKATGRTGIIAMQGGFHGRTAGALSVTHLGAYRAQFPSVVYETRAVPFGDLATLEAMLDSRTAAVILEPIQSMAGMRTSPDGYLPALVARCHANGTLVIFDEVQTGLGRLGAPFAADLFAAPADLLTLGKGLGNGLPMAAVLCTEEVAATVALGEQGTTFGGGPLACAAGLAVLDALEQDDLVARAAALETAARELLPGRGPVAAVQGRGLLLGLTTTTPANEVVTGLRELGILVGNSSDPHVVRLMPPLIIERVHLERLAATLEELQCASK